VASFNQTTPQRRLRDRAISAGAWTLGSYGADLFFRLLSNLILTRLLFPEAFGTIAAATALMAGLVLVSDFGIQAVIIQSPRGDQVDFLHSAWVFQLWRGSLIWIALGTICALMSVPQIRGTFPAGSVFADPSMPLITAVLGLNIVINGAESTSTSLNVRYLNYRPLVAINLVSKVLSLPITLIWAWIAPNVWSLVGGSLAAGLFQMLLSHIIVPGPRMGLDWNKEHFREIVRFGRWVMVSSVATFVSQQFDVVLLGILVPSSILGLYSIAKLLVNTGEGLLDRLSGTLALPIFGEVIRKDPRSFRNRYYRFRLPIEVAAGLLSGALFTAGDFIVNFLYDTRYAQAGPMLRILALGTVSYPILIIGTAFTATGDTHISAAVSILKAISLFGLVTIGFFVFGTPGAVAGVALHRVMPSVTMFFLAHRRNWIWIKHEFRIIPAFAAGILMGKGLMALAAALNIHNIHQIVHFGR
jgi:O-antigen/teichoic acid export membrane protein